MTMLIYLLGKVGVATRSVERLSKFAKSSDDGIFYFGALPLNEQMNEDQLKRNWQPCPGRITFRWGLRNDSPFCSRPTTGKDVFFGKKTHFPQNI